MWPISQALASLGSGKAAAAPRPPAVSLPSAVGWGPLSLGGLDKMHRGDAFYAVLSLAVYWLTWPTAAELSAPWGAPTAPGGGGDSGSSLLRVVLSMSWLSWLPRWVWIVLLRNAAIELSVYEGFHQLYFGALATDAVRARRLHEKDPYAGPRGGAALWRERALTCCGLLVSAVYEVSVMRWWGGGGGGGGGGGAVRMLELGSAAAGLPSLLARLGWFVAAFPLLTQVRGVHFWAAHRGMHPWWDRRNGLADGDVGAFLYRHVHCVHHKSHNVGPWSSLSMHVAEHVIYFSFLPLFAVALPATLGCCPPLHPVHLLFIKFHADLSALAGHDGHADPYGANDIGHWLHHAHFECNYGFSFPNFLDRAFGTYEDGSKYATTKKKPAGCTKPGGALPVERFAAIFAGEGSPQVTTAASCLEQLLQQDDSDEEA